MQTEVIPQSSPARCYICNQSENVEQVCHHCGRNICKEHAVSFWWIGPSILHREFKDLGLDKREGTPLPVHCRKCVRDFYAYWFFLIAVGAGVLGCAILVYGVLLYYHIIDEVIFMIFNTYTLVDKFPPKTLIDKSIVILLVGLFFYALHFWYWSIHSKKHRPPFPVVPNMDSIKIVEKMDGIVSLDEEGKYSMKPTSLKGEFTAPLQFVVRDRKRWKRHLARHRLTYRTNLPLQAGFVVFKEAENIQFDVSPNFTNKWPNTFMIEGQVGDHPFLTTTALTHTRQWDALLPYSINRFDRKEIPLPIQIIPSLVQDDTQRSIGLLIQLTPQYIKPKKFEKAVIKEFTLLAPNDLSKVLQTWPNALIGSQIVSHGTDEMQKLQVAWKDLEFDLTQGESKSFYIQFSNQINQATKLSGSLQISFTGTFSGLKTVDFFYPWGQKYSKVKTEREAIVKVDFDLSLESLRFQKLHPKAAQRDYPRVLDYSLISKLTARLESSKFYVRRVIENPARTDPANAFVVNRLWDLAGRYYEGVYPIDFHLVFTGEEITNNPSKSNMKVDFNVQAMVTSEPLRAKVDSLNQRLVTIVEETITDV